MQPTPNIRRGYRGGKAGAGVCQKLINLMSRHTVYIEPFCGYAAVLLHKRPAHQNIALDLDPQAVKGVRARLPAAIARHIASGSFPLGSDDAAAAILRTHRQSENTCSVYDSDDDAGADFRLGHVRYQVLVGDALTFLRSYPFTGNELVYCDPPYVRSARRSRGRAYRYEMDDHQHVELLALLRGLPCAVMVSGYRSALYDQTLGDWRTLEFQAQTRGGPATEVVWMNYPEPTDLHEYTHLGSTFRERERQKRQQARWAKKVAAKPLLEQKALLAGLLHLVGPTVSTEVMRSALVHFGDEDLIASSGTPGSHTRHSGDPADALTPAMTNARPRLSRCTICRSPARQRIDQALAAGASVREVAQREGLSKSVVGRHLDHRRGGVVSQKKWDTAPAQKRPAVMSKPTPGGILYAIGAPGLPYVKIGMTRTPVEKRLSSLQSGYPAPLQVFAAVAIPENLSTIEAYVHAFLYKERRTGEWFEVEIGDNAQLEAVIASAMQYAAEQEAGTAPHHQGQPPCSQQLELLALDTVG